jgi:hypothetical protein
MKILFGDFSEKESRKDFSNRQSETTVHAKSIMIIKSEQ